MKCRTFFARFMERSQIERLQSYCKMFLCLLWVRQDLATVSAVIVRGCSGGCVRVGECCPSTKFSGQCPLPIPERKGTPFFGMGLKFRPFGFEGVGQCRTPN